MFESFVISEQKGVSLMDVSMNSENLFIALLELTCIVTNLVDFHFDLNISWHVNTGKWSDILDTNIPEVSLLFPCGSLQ